MSLQEIFEEYCTYIKSLGATVTDCLLAPASDAEFERLENYLEGEVPPELRQWFQLVNGIDLDRPETTNIRGCSLFPILRPQSLTELLDFMSSMSEDAFAAIEEGPVPERPFPLILQHGNIYGAVVECANKSGKVTTYDLISGGDAYGYYHESITDFVAGCLINAQAGHYEIVDGGVNMPHTPPPRDPFSFPLNFYAFGFQKENGIPPRLPWPTDPYENVDLTKPIG